MITTGGNCTAEGPCVYKDVEATLKAAGPHAVAYGFDQSAARDVGALFLKECAKTITNGTSPGHHNGVLVDGMAGAISFQERVGKPGGGKGILIQNERVGALSTLNNQSVFSIGSFNSEGMKSENPSAGVYETDMARTLDLTGGNPAGYQGGIAVLDNRCWSLDEKMGQTYVHDDMGNTLSARDYKQPQAVVVEPVMLQNNQNNAMIAQDGVSYTLPASAGMGGGYVPQYKDPPIVTETYQEQTGALCASGYNKNGTQEAQNGMYVTGSAVRRLTPDECASLQGFPRWWCNIGEWTDSKGKLHKDADSPKYKAYGNSIAVGYDNNQSGFWCWLARRICAQYERRVTMASLFDGIGGFHLAFGAAGAIPVWASEIEEFPIAVTKIRFPEVEE